MVGCFPQLAHADIMFLAACFKPISPLINHYLKSRKSFAINNRASSFVHIVIGCPDFFNCHTFVDKIKNFMQNNMIFFHYTGPLKCENKNLCHIIV